MRYLNTREVFLKNFKEIKIEKEILSSYNNDEMIMEAFENDITWGGSLLGRFINSTIRKAKLQYNYYRVKSIARKIEDELLGLISDNFTEEQKDGVKLIIVKIALLTIYQTIFDLDSSGKELPEIKRMSENKKINALLGEEQVYLYGTELSSGNKGLIKLAEEYINLLPDGIKIGNLDKNTILSKLNQFRDEISALKNYYQEKNIFSDDVIYLLNLTADINKDYKSEEPQKEEPSSNNVLTKDKLIVGNWYKYTDKSDNKVWLVKLINLTNVVNKGENSDWLSKDDEINDTSEGKLSKDSVFVVKQKLPGENFTGDTENTGIIVSISNLEELTNQPSKTNQDSKQTNKKSKNDIQVDKIYHYISTKDKKKKVVKVLNKEFQVDNTGKQISKLPDDVVFVALIDDNGKQTNTKYPVNFNLLQERRILSNFDLFFNNYIMEDMIPVDSDRINKINKGLEEAEEEYDEQETEKTVEEEIKEILKNLNEEKLENYLNDDKSDFLKFGEQIKEEDRLEDLDDEEFNLVTIIKKLNSVFEKNKSNEINSAQNILYFIETYKKIKDTNLEKIGDLKKSWIKIFGTEQDNWIITQDDIKLRDSIDKYRYTFNLIDERGQNRVINIVNLFGKAYSCFATQLIPSGRPGGRISTKTRNEYVYIGGGNEPNASENSGPGPGPWANLKVFTTFSEAIGSFLAQQKFIKVFDSGGIELASGKIASGNVLTEFIRDMIDESKIRNFTTRRSEFITKYFGLKTTISDAEPSGSGTIINKEDTDGSEIYWESVRQFNSNNLKPGNFIVIDFELKPQGKEKKSEIIMGEVLDIRNNKLALKFQAGSISIPNSYAEYQLTAESKFGLEIHSKREVWYALINLPIDTADKSWQNMVYFGSIAMDKILNMTIHVIRPAQQNKAGKPSRTRERSGLGILYKYKDGKEEALIHKDVGRADNSKIIKDKNITGEEIFNKLNSELEKLEAPERKFKYELKETLRKN